MTPINNPLPFVYFNNLVDNGSEKYMAKMKILLQSGDFQKRIKSDNTNFFYHKTKLLTTNEKDQLRTVLLKLASDGYSINDVEISKEIDKHFALGSGRIYEKNLASIKSIANDASKEFSLIKKDRANFKEDNYSKEDSFTNNDNSDLSINNIVTRHRSGIVLVQSNTEINSPRFATVDDELQDNVDEKTIENRIDTKKNSRVHLNKIIRLLKCGEFQKRAHDEHSLLATNRDTKLTRDEQKQLTTVLLQVASEGYRPDVDEVCEELEKHFALGENRLCTWNKLEIEHIITKVNSYVTLPQENNNINNNDKSPMNNNPINYKPPMGIKETSPQENNNINNNDKYPMNNNPINYKPPRGIKETSPQENNNINNNDKYPMDNNPINYKPPRGIPDQSAPVQTEESEGEPDEDTGLYF